MNVIIEFKDCRSMYHEVTNRSRLLQEIIGSNKGAVE